MNLLKGEMSNIWSNTETYFKRYFSVTGTSRCYSGFDYSPDICYFLNFFFQMYFIFYFLWSTQNKLFTVIQYKKLHNTELYLARSIFPSPDQAFRWWRQEFHYQFRHLNSPVCSLLLPPIQQAFLSYVGLIKLLVHWLWQKVYCSLKCLMHLQNNILQFGIINIIIIGSSVASHTYICLDILLFGHSLWCSNELKAKYCVHKPLFLRFSVFLYGAGFWTSSSLTLITSSPLVSLLLPSSSFCKLFRNA